jgi:hypothetical protein
MRAVIRPLFCYHESGETMETFGVRIYDDNGKHIDTREFNTKQEVEHFCDTAEFDEVDW